MREPHELLKSQVDDDVNMEIANRAGESPPPATARKIDEIAGTFREHAVDDVADAERGARRSRGIARLSQVIDYGFFLLYALLALRFLLALIAARSSAGFVKFIVSVSDPVFSPFKNIVTSTDAGRTVMLSIAVALIAYLVLHLVINRLLRLIGIRRTEI
jgi:uncharacterized protein YggT (Ycf19 family)